MPYSFTFYKSSTSAVDNAGWKRNGDTGFTSDLLWLSENVAGNTYGWVASPSVNAPAGGLNANITLVTKFYSIGSKTMTFYVGLTTSQTTTASATVSGTSKSSVATSSTSDLRTFSTDMSFPQGTRYVSINHNNTTGLASHFYLYSYSCLYK